MTAQHLPRRPQAKLRVRFPLRPLILLLTVLLVLLSVALVVLSPFALDALGAGEEWARRSEIGQTYGAAAALLSVLALAAIGVSLVLQAREAKIAREQASRTTHTELLFMAMEDPIYREFWGPFTTAQDEREFKQQLYTNLIVSYWQSRYELGTFTEAHLRHGAGTLFMGAERAAAADIADPQGETFPRDPRRGIPEGRGRRAVPYRSIASAAGAQPAGRGHAAQDRRPGRAAGPGPAGGGGAAAVRRRRGGRLTRRTFGPGATAAGGRRRSGVVRRGTPPARRTAGPSGSPPGPWRGVRGWRAGRRGGGS